jgi:hypothetical protein
MSMLSEECLYETRKLLPEDEQKMFDELIKANRL